MDICLIVMLAQALVGVLGFWFHIQANLVEPGHSLFDRLVNGAPPMAPLLFPNLVGLALIGICVRCFNGYRLHVIKSVIPQRGRIHPLR